MAKVGETQVSHLALISPKITQANADLLLAGIKDRSKREVEELLSRITADGRLLDREPEVELRIRLTKRQLEILDRAREVLSHGGYVPSLPEVMIKALRRSARKARSASESGASGGSQSEVGRRFPREGGSAEFCR